MKVILLAALTAIIAACSPAGNQIVPITAIPTGELTITPGASAARQTAVPTATNEPAAQAAQIATATPLENNLPSGDAMQNAAATDAAIHLTPRSPLTFDEQPVPITFDEFYDGFNMRTGLILSDKLVSLDSQQVVMEGYMAPPLKPELDYFVLTRIRLAFCPFCSTAGDWPDDIALIYLPVQTAHATEYPVRVTGRVEVGASVDQETGMVSLVRIYADELEIIN
jgi:hypothetical protein